MRLSKMEKKAREKAKELIKEFEGLSLKAYRCPGGYWTIGYGHRISGDRPEISLEEAETLLDSDVNSVIFTLRNTLGKKFDELNENQQAALISFVFNIGASNFEKSTVRKLIMENAPPQEIAREMRRWVYAGGKVLWGLVKRRKKEAALFLSEEENGGISDKTKDKASR
jgi:lysozyme